MSLRYFYAQLAEEHLDDGATMRHVSWYANNGTRIDHRAFPPYTPPGPELDDEPDPLAQWFDAKEQTYLANEAMHGNLGQTLTQCEAEMHYATQCYARAKKRGTPDAEQLREDAENKQRDYQTLYRAMARLVYAGVGSFPTMHCPTCDKAHRYPLQHQNRPPLPWEERKRERERNEPPIPGSATADAISDEGE